MIVVVNEIVVVMATCGGGGCGSGSGGGGGVGGGDGGGRRINYLFTRAKVGLCSGGKLWQMTRPA